MSDLLVFYPQGRHLYIEFLGAKYIERQPKTATEAHEFSASIKPIVQQLDAYVEKHNLKEIIELNLKGVPISKLNSETAVHLLKLLMEIRPDKGLLEKIRITNSNPIFNMVYKSVKSRLPERVSSIVEFANNDKFF
jgi:plasmid replication initiation protein